MRPEGREPLTSRHDWPWDWRGLPGLPETPATSIEVSPTFRTGPHVEREDTDASLDRILQVLANLLSNALKFSGRGGQVDLSVARRKSDVRFSVTDTGVGIPADKVGRDLRAFWTARLARGSPDPRPARRRHHVAPAPESASAARESGGGTPIGPHMQTPTPGGHRGAKTVASPSANSAANPLRQLRGAIPNSALALAFNAPRSEVP